MTAPYAAGELCIVASPSAVAQEARAPLGIRVASPPLALARTLEWTDGVVGRLPGGVLPGRADVDEDGAVEMARAGVGRGQMLEGHGTQLTIFSQAAAIAKSPAVSPTRPTSWRPAGSTPSASSASSTASR